MNWMTEIIQDVRAEVPGCPSPTVERAVLKAAREYFEQSGSWVEDIDFIVKAGRVKKDLTMRVPGRFLYVLRAAPAGLPFEIDGSTYTLLEPQAEDVEIALTVAVGVADKKTEVGDREREDMAEAVMHGALARLFRQKQPWGDMLLAAANAEDFRKAIGRARGKAAAPGVAVKHYAVGRSFE